MRKAGAKTSGNTRTQGRMEPLGRFLKRPKLVTWSELVSPIQHDGRGDGTILTVKQGGALLVRIVLLWGASGSCGPGTCPYGGGGCLGMSGACEQPSQEICGLLNGEGRSCYSPS